MAMNAYGVSAELATQSHNSANQKVALASLSQLTGFPAEFIKKELLIESDDMSLPELRVRVLDYLDRTIQQY